MKLFKKTTSVLEYRANLWFWKIVSLFFVCLMLPITGAYPKERKISCYRAAVVRCETITRYYLSIETKRQQIDRVSQVEARKIPSRYKSDLYEVLLASDNELLVLEIKGETTAIQIENTISNYLLSSENEPLTVGQSLDFPWFMFIAGSVCLLLFLYIPVNSAVILDRSTSQLIITRNYILYRSRDVFELNAIARIEIEQTSRSNTQYYPVIYLDNGEEEDLYFTGLYHNKREKIEQIVNEMRLFLNLQVAGSSEA